MASRKSKKLTSAVAAAIGQRGGSAGTDAQTAARKANGKLGGRPHRVCECCGHRVRGGHLDPAQDAVCKRPGWRWVKVGADV